MNNLGFRLEFTNEFGETFVMERSSINLEGTTENLVLNETIHDFLRMIGYSMPNNYVLLESLTENELTSLEEFLDDLRQGD